MNQRQWSAIKWFIAIVVGLPVTIFGGYHLIAGGLFAAIVVTSEPFSFAALLFALWFVAGLAGLTGFWMWVVQRQSPSRVRRLITVSLLAAGIIAAAPLAVWENALVAWAGIGTGLLAVVSLLCNHQLEPTGNQRG